MCQLWRGVLYELRRIGIEPHDTVCRGRNAADHSLRTQLPEAIEGKHAIEIAIRLYMAIVGMRDQRDNRPGSVTTRWITSTAASGSAPR
jgi:hypothetical protein